jgi:hypothetical protein
MVPRGEPYKPGFATELAPPVAHRLVPDAVVGAFRNFVWHRVTSTAWVVGWRRSRMTTRITDVQDERPAPASGAAPELSALAEHWSLAGATRVSSGPDRAAY